MAKRAYLCATRSSLMHQQVASAVYLTSTILHALEAVCFAMF